MNNVITQNVAPELQESAQLLLVALAAISPKTVIDELLARFEPGIVPHYFIIKAFGEVGSTATRFISVVISSAVTTVEASPPGVAAPA